MLSVSRRMKINGTDKIFTETFRCHLLYPGSGQLSFKDNRFKNKKAINSEGKKMLRHRVVKLNLGMYLELYQNIQQRERTFRHLFFLFITCDKG